MNKALKNLLKKPYLKDFEALKKLFPELYALINELNAGESDLIKITIQNQLLELSVRLTAFKLRDAPYRLISFQNIQLELEEKELDAWQKLIRILTHEIMNSVTPITSLASSLKNLTENKSQITDYEDIADIKEGIYAIQKRGEGLLRFTETYRSLTKIPPPKFRLVEAHALLERIHILFKPVLKKHQVDFSLTLPKHMVAFIADVELIEQVIINLLKNAIEATKKIEEPKIIISANKNSLGNAIIEIRDNGSGIAPADLEQIFVPFFTTKKDGSGIGLSLSRQIMRLHKGKIEVQSIVGEGSVFRLIL